MNESFSWGSLGWKGFRLSLVQRHKHGLWRQTALSRAPLPHPRGRGAGVGGCGKGLGWAGLSAALVQEAETSREGLRAVTRIPDSLEDKVSG